ncbi:MAG: hypothetical protein NTV70_25560 [Acidobacteria bacterium]|nr:hypothetical protein [Acidobacteriota bacterium]
MADPTAPVCRICDTRRPRRFCLGVGADICSPCCGQEREVTVDCPFDCEFLAEGRRHEKRPELDPTTIPNADIRVTESFLAENEPLLMVASRALFEAAAQVPGVIDYDVREALEAMIKTHRTQQSGLIYESRPSNPLAGAIQQLLDQQLNAYRDAMTQRAGMNVIRDASILGVLCFLQRIEMQQNNGRRRGRAFLHMLSGFGPPPPPPPASQLVAG